MPVPASQLAEQKPQNEWRSDTSVDKITDVRRDSLATMGQGGRLSISITCSSSVPWMGVSFHASNLWPSNDTYYVSTRLDSEPAIGLSAWNGGRGWASPPSVEEERTLIDQLLTHRRFLVRIDSVIMEGDSAEDEFDLSGLPEAFAVFEDECKRNRKLGPSFED